ncbi:MAG: hypothetical protein U0527_11325, partial [Candidatus Eisenbacteria bacterium]
MDPATPLLGRLARVGSAPWSRFIALLLQVGGVLYLAAVCYELEGQAFERFSLVAAAGFAVHYLLPLRLRLGFFVALSLFAIVVLFGPVQGAWLVTIGLALIGLCHLPVAFPLRIVLILIAGTALALFRLRVLTAPWSGAIWPVLGSMFMLRLVIYLYDLKHKNAPASFLKGLAYFFMLPNVVFPLFPVVDYQSFCRTYYNEADRTLIYQSGVSWMLRGVVQLVLYRLVYQHLPIDTTSVVDATQLFRYLLWPFLLYLQVSGLFHLVVGLLHLFGFNLPETHHLFYLASSYTDFWRRINIYWKDFMMKVFYYPAFFRLRRFGNNAALFVGTIWVFFATWVLHSYQWFWLRGSVLLKASDTLFWAILALLVSINVLYEANRPMKRKLGRTTVTRSESLRRAFQSLGVFTSICVLWSLWISDSVVDWLSLFSMLGRAGGRGAELLGLLVGFVVLFVGLAFWYERRAPVQFTFWRSAARCVLAIVVLLLIGSPTVYRRLEPSIADTIQRLKYPGLNRRDAALRQRDYYEKLSDVGWDNPELAKVFMQRPADWGSIRYRPDLAKLTGGLPYMELLPNAEGRHRGALVKFNRWGMRDQDYEQVPATGTYRIALVGASHTFASGVAQDESFESLIEERLNREGGLGPFQRVEILNFAVEDFSPLDVVAEVEQRVFEFHPNAVCYVEHRIDARSAAERLAKVMSADQQIPYAAVESLAVSVGAKRGMSVPQLLRLLLPKKPELLRWCYGRLGRVCDERGVARFVVLLPILTEDSRDTDAADLLAAAARAGFHTIDLSGVYDGHRPEDLVLAPWDNHPNAQGHHLVADRLYDELRTNANLLWRANAADRDQG